jgi:hypothetical protein
LLAASFGAGQVAYSFLWFFLFFVEIWLEISIFIDVFRSHDLRGWAKAAWILLVLVFPIIGILAYLIFRGDKMRAHQVAAQADSATMFRDYLAQAGQGRVSKVDELHRLSELRDRGYVSAEEFEQLKSEIMNQDSGASV